MGDMEEFFYKPARGVDAFLEGGVCVGLAEDTDSVPKTDVVVVKPRPVVKGAPARLGSGFPRYVTVVIEVPSVACLDGSGDRWEPLVTQKAVDRRVGVWVERGSVGETVAMLGPVGRMQVDDHMGVIFPVRAC